MPNINLQGVEESAGEGFKMLEPGGYVCHITSVEPHEDKQYVRIYWDVHEGERARTYEDSQWPPSDVASWKETALPMLKHKLHVLADDNPGFDAEDEFIHDRWENFKGKVFGAVVRKRLYTRSDGTDGEGIEIGTWKRAEEIRTGAWKPMATRDTRSKDAQAEPAAMPAKDVQRQAYLADVEIPF